MTQILREGVTRFKLLTIAGLGSICPGTPQVPWRLAFYAMLAGLRSTALIYRECWTAESRPGSVVILFLSALETVSNSLIR